MTDEELLKREDRLLQAMEDTMTAAVKKMNDMAIRLEVPTSQANSTNDIMDALLVAMLNRRCTIIMKDGRRLDGVWLKAFDKNTLLCYGYSDVGYLDPVYRELGINRSDVSIVSDFIDTDAIAARIRWIKMRNDPTA